MAILFSNEFNIPEETLKDLGVFNVFLDEDTRNAYIEHWGLTKKIIPTINFVMVL